LAVYAVFHLNAGYFPTIKWQFFMTADGVHTEYPAHGFSKADCSSVYATRHRWIIFNYYYYYYYYYCYYITAIVLLALPPPLPFWLDDGRDVSK